MGKPPALLGDSQSLTFTGIYESLRTVNRSKFTVEEAFDERFTEFKPLSVGLQVPCCVDSKMSEKSAIWRTPEILGTGAQRVSHTKGESGGGRSPEGDHVHMLISIPPKYAVAQVVGFLKGKSAIHIARTYGGQKKNFTGQNFWARGYYVSTAGRDEDSVREYIRKQEEEDRSLDQLNMFE